MSCASAPVYRWAGVSEGVGVPVSFMAHRFYEVSAACALTVKVPMPAIFGGTAEYLALWFKNSGVESGFYWYVSAMIAVSLLVYLRLPETRDVSRIDRD